MFKFLKDDNLYSNITNQTNTDSVTTLPVGSQSSVSNFQKLFVTDLHQQIISQVPSSTYSATPTGKSLRYVKVNQLLRSHLVQSDDTVKRIHDATSDLIPGVYEGGFKIWECTFDLISHMEDGSKYPIDKTTKVLDLGCGSGLLGLFALSYGALVDFHDYNPEVLNFLTIPNVILNHQDEGIKSCQFFSGDWKSFHQHISEYKPIHQFQYDYILTSETVYNMEYLPALYSLIKQCLKPTGIMLLAAKTYYFGVGGGTKAFQQIIDDDKALESEILKVFRDGVQREIIGVRFRR